MKNPLYNIIKSMRIKRTDEAFEKLDNVLKYLIKKNFVVNRCNRVGSGAYGTVYQINKDKVLKVTEDKTEGNTMSILKKHPCVNIVKVYGVFKSKINNKVYYFIVEEMLTKATRKWKYFANYYQWTGKFITERSVVRGKKLFAKDCIVNQKNINHYSDQYKWIEKVAKYFDKHEIKFGDLHGGNIMRRDDRHVLIDLGVSKAPQQKVVNV